MTSARDQQIRALYLAALERPPAERSSFVSQLSGADEDLKRSVERLLSEQNATDVGASGDSGDVADFSTGAQVGHYRIEGVLGRGGMGVVYRAIDTKLQRPVAIKFLSTSGADADSRRRFEQEARTTSALNHPHIVTVHDVGEHDGRQYIVSELVDGGTLDDWSTATRRRSWRQSVEILTGVADALASAHAAGVLHRDVKPGNVLIGSNGYAKLADFGLAKLVGRTVDPSAPKGLSRDTRAGVVVGTVAYMSPEQAAGHPLDARSDVFSFGVVLYELVAGRRPFESSNELEVLKAIAHAAPEPLPDGTPELLRMIVDKALEKEPGDRYQTMQDLVADLKRVTRRATSSTVAPGSAAASRRARLPWLVAAACALALVTGVPAALYWRDVPPAPPRMELEIEVPGDDVDELALSPDGTQLAYYAVIDGVDGIWTRPIASREARALPDSEEARGLFWSPDGRSLAFFQEDGLKHLNISGGGVQSIGPPTPAGLSGTWVDDGTILFAAPAPPGVAIGRVSAAGGEVTLLTASQRDRGENGHVLPRLLPDGEHFIFMGTSPQSKTATVYVGSLAGDVPKSLFTFEQTRTIVSGDRGPGLAYASGYVLHFSDDRVIARRFDPDTLALRGDPVTVLDSVSSFSVSSDLLVYRVATSTSASRPQRRLAWYDRTGRRLAEVDTPRDFLYPALSPNGRYVAVTADPPNSPWGDIWTIDLESGLTRPLTFDRNADEAATWSPDGERIAFGSGREAPGTLNSIYETAVNGAGTEKRLFLSPELEVTAPHSWSRDGRYLVFHRSKADRSGFWVLPLGGDAPPFALIDFSSPAPAAPLPPIGQARISPDGRWFAYAIDEATGYQIVVQPFPNAGDGKWQVSVRGGYNPRWRNDGRELFYVAPDGTIMAVDVPENLGSRFENGAPRALFKTSLAFPSARAIPENLFDVFPDGERFLINEPPSVDASQTGAGSSAPPAEPIHVIVNWTTGLGE